ncbi:MAG TPA: multiheme c-type cytochrome [Candidatus Sulfotelmatobacter sp.]|nr:multiheme c-type cytochrome [Candidatus Sulfotelmatobacter sp.]
MAGGIGRGVGSGILVGLGAWLGISLAAAAQTLPQDAVDKHLGVNTCSGSTCHGSAAPWRTSDVEQNEYITWSQKDKHAKAYAALSSERGKRIARNLGIGDATKATICLSCHTDYVAEDKRGRNYDMANGVGCEACHGGGERFLGVHVSGLGTHADNVKAGMYPTEDPVARAKLCLSCHFGNSSKFVTHRIMGAGHPRMPFELDTFTAIEPAHYRIDDDYKRRKVVANGVKTWAVGQAMQVAAFLDGLVDPKRDTHGVFPELVFFDCQACHHAMNTPRWEARASTGLPPGTPRLNDANLIMLRVIANRTDPALGAKLREQTLALHRASTEGTEAMINAAKALRVTVGDLIGKFAARNFAKDDMAALLAAVVQDGIQAGDYVDYSGAEQATMALGTIVAALKTAGDVDQTQYTALKAALDKCYEATAKDDAYQPRTFVAALQEVNAAIPKF